MHVGVLGTTEAVLGGRAVDLGPRRQRAVLTALALHAGDPVSADSLADLVWEGSPPATAEGTLHAYVARLRRALEPDRSPRSPATVLVRRPGGYVLAVDDADLDARVLAATVDEVHAEVAGLGVDAAPGTVAPERAAALASRLDEALALPRGVPYADLGDAPAAVAARARLEDLLLVAREDRAVLELQQGRPALAATALEQLTAAHPLRERFWELRAVALVRAGRQAEALDALRSARVVLAEELGIDPGPALRELQDRVLRQDPGLTATVATPTPTPTPTPVPAGPPAAWPLVDRDAERGVVAAALAAAAAGTTRCVAVTGEPGIGKSRLVAEAVRDARAAGARVVAGGCTQDDGAPPLHPWAAVLEGLGAALPTLAGQHDRDAHFRAWEEVVRTVRTAAGEPLVVVLEDLHWADASTLRVLRLLLESSTDDRLLVLVTWRDQPAPSGLLAEVAETLARRSADRVALAGLDDVGTHRLVEAVAGASASPDEVRALRRRTAGNPFFLVELARLVRDGTAVAALLDGGAAPAAVQDVVVRRLDALPSSTAGVLRAAAVVGQEVDLETLAVACGVAPDPLLDDVDAGVAAGLLQEVGVDRWRFSHALARDAVRATLPTSRAARLHLRLAEALEGRPGREGEAARHWGAAGPAHAGRAWRACLLAAEAAQRLHAREEAVDHAAAALRLVETDPAATLADRLDVREQHAEALRRAGRWLDLRDEVRAMVRLAEQLPGSEGLDRLVRAATMSIDGALWQTSEQGRVDDHLVGALRSALHRLPPGDSPQRCRVMVALVDETYYVAAPAEREALTDEALAMARRIGDERLLLWCCLTVATSCWRAGNAPQRHQVLLEALDLAGRLGDLEGRSSATALLAAVSQELGDVEAMDRWVAEGYRLAHQLRHRYAEMVLLALELPWAAMRGDDERVVAGFARLQEVVGGLALAMGNDAVRSVAGVQLMWSGREREYAHLLGELEGAAALPLQTLVTAMLCRAGDGDAARAYLEAHPADLDHDGWYSSLVWATAAETGAELGIRELAAAAYDRLAPLAGRPASTGSAAAIGPVDAWLALAATAVGRSDLAAAHTRETHRLCEAWRVPRVRRWFDEALDRVAASARTT